MPGGTSDAAPRAPVRVAICDDSLGFPLLVGAWLGQDARFAVVGTVDSGEALKRLVAAERPDAIVLDYILPDVDDSGTLIAALREIHPEVRILLMSSATADVLAGAARDAGADGHLGKSTTPEVLCDAVFQVAHMA